MVLSKRRWQRKLNSFAQAYSKPLVHTVLSSTAGGQCAPLKKLFISILQLAIAKVLTVSRFHQKGLASYTLVTKNSIHHILFKPDYFLE